MPITDPKNAAAWNWIQDILPDKRAQHSRRVAELAYELALFHELDHPLDAYLAGLLHDNAKYDTPETLAARGIPPHLCRPSLYDRYPKVWHALVGPRQALSITTNTRVLNAMRWHTTGRARMRPLTQVLFVADFCEPNRDGAWHAVARKAAYENLDKATAIIAQLLVHEHGDQCFWATQACLDDYRKRPNIGL
jgi:predicted HD superfamily hydrolase involved in NAD metabolism